MKKCLLWVSLIMAIGAFTANSVGASNAGRLKGYNAQKEDVSVSGLSSGAFMAAQLHVAYSGVFDKGAGMIAGGAISAWGPMRMIRPTIFFRLSPPA